MKVIYDSASLLHDPPYEILSGQLVPYLESPARWTTIKQELESSPSFEFAKASNDIDVILHVKDVHSDDYTAYLETAYQRWVEDGGDKTAVIPESFPHPKLLSTTHGPPEFLSPIAKAGVYCFDLSCPITEATYPAIIASARVALSAAQALSGATGRRGVFALSRPPGHHAGSSLCGGYCFINNIAVAARYLQSISPEPHLPIAILDIDYHHGNGTQEIFYSDRSVLYVSAPCAERLSLFLDSSCADFTGSQAEMGAGEGVGFTINHSLHRGTADDAYCAALMQAAAQIQAFNPTYVLVSLGVDTYIDDPISDFALTQACYPRMGTVIAQLGKPTLFVMEGGYDVKTIGQNVRALLEAFERATI